MPLYEFQCRKCDHTFETILASRLLDTVQCPACNAAEVERLIALPAPGRVLDSQPTNCRGDGPPCGAPMCGRKT